MKTGWINKYFVNFIKVVAVFVAAAFAGCGDGKITSGARVRRLPVIDPDYSGTVIPWNIAPLDFVNRPAVVSDLVGPGQMAVLVVPIDKEAPAGRLITKRTRTTIRDDSASTNSSSNRSNRLLPRRRLRLRPQARSRPLAAARRETPPYGCHRSI